MRKIKFLIFLLITFMFISTVSCGGKKTEVKEKPEIKQEVKKESIDLKTQAGYEKVINSLNIPIFENSEFMEIKKSDFYGNEIIKYTVPVGEGTPFIDHQTAEDSLISFYKYQIETKLSSNGWSRAPGSDDNRMMVMKKTPSVKMFTVSIFPSMAELDTTKKTYLFNYSE